MRPIQILVTFLLFINLAAAQDFYRCKPELSSSTTALELEKDLPLENGQLNVGIRDCSITGNDNYPEICVVSSATLMISSSDALPSLLVTKKGEVHRMSCGQEHQQQQQQQQDQQQQQQQQQPQRGGPESPGHGGGTKA